LGANDEKDFKMVQMNLEKRFEKRNSKKMEKGKGGR